MYLMQSERRYKQGLTRRYIQAKYQQIYLYDVNYIEKLLVYLNDFLQ